MRQRRRVHDRGRLDTMDRSHPRARRAMSPATILVFGTGAFAARIVFDIAATATQPVRVVVAGRNPDRLAWLVTASAARAVIFATPATFVARKCDLVENEQVEGTLATERPKVVVQAASVQTSSV